MFLIPSSPADKIAANAKYGFADGSTERTSKRVPIPRDAGTRTSGERLDGDQATYTGASYPGVKRLYELTVGFETAVKLRTCVKIPAKK